MINKVIGAKNGKNGCINVKTVTWASFYFAVHAVWWEKIKNGGARETWEELRYPISKTVMILMSTITIANLHLSQNVIQPIRIRSQSG